MVSHGDLMEPSRVERGQALAQRVLESLGQAILGRENVLRLVLVAFLGRGHILLEGLPGLGKTELVKNLARLMNLKFSRIQFTPDLLPTDITGTNILEEGNNGRSLKFHEGPIFANIVLADEINRASPKTQAALLEAMQEGRVTTMGVTYDLPQPFLVLATQNPIELEGTYPLPEAQMDRFMFKVDIAGVDPRVVETIISTRRHGRPPQAQAVLTEAELNELFGIVDDVFLPTQVSSYMARLVAATHPDVSPIEIVKKYVKYGASPRAAIAMAESARVLALIEGQPNVSFDDVAFVAPSAMGHRTVLDYSARLDGVTPRHIVETLLKQIPQLERDLPSEVRREG